MAKKPETDKDDSRSLTAEMERLEKLIDWFYSDEFNLDEAEKKYAEATALSKDIEKQLGGIENDIKVLNKDFTKD